MYFCKMLNYSTILMLVTDFINIFRPFVHNRIEKAPPFLEGLIRNRRVLEWKTGVFSISQKLCFWNGYTIPVQLYP